MIRKTSSVQVSEIVFNILDLYYGEELFAKYELGLGCYLDTFNNCRETGYMLNVMDNYNREGKHAEDFFVWAFQHRNSDNIVVIATADRPSINNMFSENAYKNNLKTFNYNQYNEVAEYIRNKIVEHFVKEN